MLCPSVFQPLPPPLTMRPFLDLHWPVRSLWPETRPLVFHVEQEMLRHMQDMRQSVEYMERLHQKIFEEIDHASSSSSAAVFTPITFQDVARDDGSFALSLDTQEFSPEELSVKQVGGKLRVSGRSERRHEDGRGSYSYRCQEFRQDFELPHGVDPEAVTCSLRGGRLQIQAPRERAGHDGKERIVPISVAPSALAIASSEAGSPSPSESSPAEKN